MTNRERIEALGRDNAAVRAHLEMLRHFPAATWLETVEALALYLALENARLFQLAIEAEMRAAPRHLLVPKSIA